MAGEINRSINIYLNEAEVEASLDKLQKSAAKLEQQMGKAANPTEFKKLSDAFDNTNTKIGNLTKQLNGELNPSLRQMENAVTKTRNELKNMATGTEEFAAKAKKLAEMEAGLNKIKQEAFGVGKAIESTGKGAGIFSTLKEKAQDFAKGLPGIGQAISAMMGPFGLLIGAITGLVLLIKQNAEVADKFSYIMGGLNKVIHTLADDLVNLIKNGFEKLVDAFKNPAETFIKITQAIGNAILHPAEAMKQIGEAFSNYGKHLATAAQEGYNAAQKLDELTTQQAKLRNEIARTQIAIEQQTTAMKDATKTDEERLAAAKKVVELETANSGRKIKAIQLEIDALEEKNKGIKLSNEEEAQLMDLQTQKTQAIADKEAAIRKATNQAAALDAELTAKKLKEAMVIEAIEPITSSAIKATETVGDFVKKTAGTVIEGVKTFRSYADMQFKKFTDNWGATVQAGANFMQTVFGAVSEGMTIASEKQLKQEKKETEEKKKYYKSLLDHKKISEREYNAQVAKMDAELHEKQRAQKKKSFIADKAMKITMAVINTALAIMNAFATMPYPASIVMAALAGAAGAVQIGVIAAQPVPEFAKGGIARGASHSAGGISLINSDGRKVGEMEGDEPYLIFSRDTYKNNGRLIDALLDSSLNRGGAKVDLSAMPNQPRFNFGGVYENIKRAHFATGGVFANNNNSADLQNSLLIQLVDKLNKPVRAEVVYQDITEKGTALNRAGSRASFSTT